jgi:hypothetical protein
VDGIVSHPAFSDHRLNPAVSAAAATATSRHAVYYLSSPSYPGRYPADCDCTWSVATCNPPDGASNIRTTVNITTIDFELDVRRAGRCHDVIEISGKSVTSLSWPSSLPPLQSGVGSLTDYLHHTSSGKRLVWRLRAVVIITVSNSNNRDNGFQ